jgi:hypothetical protein
MSEFSPIPSQLRSLPCRVFFFFSHSGNALNYRDLKISEAVAPVEEKAEAANKATKLQRAEGPW